MLRCAGLCSPARWPEDVVAGGAIWIFGVYANIRRIDDLADARFFRGIYRALMLGYPVSHDGGADQHQRIASPIGGFEF
jgi:hypothetical protein